MKYKTVRTKNRGRDQNHRGRGHGRDSRNNPPDNHQNHCGKCGGSHSASQCCPALGRKCNHCYKIGHFKSVCKKRRRKARKADDAQVEESSEVEESPNFWFDTVENVVTNTALWTVMLPVCGSSVKFKVDTGADVTLMDTNTYKHLA